MTVCVPAMLQDKECAMNIVSGNNNGRLFLLCA